MCAKILHLTLYEQHFRNIARRVKRYEYREYKLHWRRKLHNRKYDEIVFTNGYGAHRPQMRVECKAITLRIKKGEPVYVITLGKILETKNYLSSV